MAAAFRAAGSPVYSAVNVANGALAPVSPGSAVNGDALVLFVWTASIAATATTPTNWHPVAGFPKRSGTAGGGSLYMFTRIHDGSANDDPSTTLASLTTGTSGTPAGAVVMAWSDMSESLDGTIAVSDLAAQTTTTVIPAFTTATNGSMVIGFALKCLTADPGGTTARSSVATFTERLDSGTASGIGHVMEISDLLKTTAGSSGTATVTWVDTGSARALAVTVAFMPSIAVVPAAAAASATASAGLAANVMPAEAAAAATASAVVTTPTPSTPVVLTPAYDNLVRALGPALYWRLNEASGNALDSSGNGRTGVPGASVTQAVAGGLTGDSDTAISVPGLSAGTVVASAYAPFVNGTARTLAGLAKRADFNSNDLLFGSVNSTSSPFLYLTLNTWDVYFSPSFNATGLPGTYKWTAAWPSTGAWVHWAVVFDETANTAELFIDGVSQGALTVTDPYDAAPGAVILGGDFGGSTCWDGSLDEFAIFERALSSTEIAALSLAADTTPNPLTAAGVAVATATLLAPPVVVPAAAAAVAAATASLAAIVRPQAAPATAAAGNLVVSTGGPAVVPAAAVAVAAASAVVSAKQPLALAAAPAVASATAALAANVMPQAAVSSAAVTARVATPQALALGAAAASAAATASLAPNVMPGTATAAAAATALVSAKQPLVLSAAAGVATAAGLVVQVPGPAAVVPAVAAAVATATAALAPNVRPAAAPAVAATSAVVSAPAPMVPAAAAGVASATARLAALVTPASAAGVASATARLAANVMPGEATAAATATATLSLRAAIFPAGAAGSAAASATVATRANVVPSPAVGVATAGAALAPLVRPGAATGESSAGTVTFSPNVMPGRAVALSGGPAVSVTAAALLIRPSAIASDRALVIASPADRPTTAARPEDRKT